jgi:ribonuclease BN (tRNA processing enzyme)
MRLTVVGSGPAAPQADTPASGLLVESVSTAVLLDCGSGVVARLRTLTDPGALDGVVIGHFHADHYIDLTALRYLYPWPGTGVDRPAVWLPPGGPDRLRALAPLINERERFFDDAFDLYEYADGVPFTIGDLTVVPSLLHHYVPARALAVTGDGGGSRLVYGGDTGPTEALVAAAAGADLLVAEATLASEADDEQSRGHSTAEEAIAMARRAGVGRLVLTHYPSARRPFLQALAAATRDLAVDVARPGLHLDVRPQRLPDRSTGLARSGSSEAIGSGSTDAMRSRMASPALSSPSRRSAVRQ